MSGGTVFKSGTNSAGLNLSGIKVNVGTRRRFTENPGRISPLIGFLRIFY